MTVDPGPKKEHFAVPAEYFSWPEEQQREWVLLMMLPKLKELRDGAEMES